MMLRSKTSIGSLIWNLLLVFIVYSITRLLFVICNGDLYYDHLSFGYLCSLMLAGIRFDCSAILYLNSWFIVAFLLPLHWKEMNIHYYRVLRWFFVPVNALGIIANLCDCAYFVYTGRRTTWNVLQEFGGESNFLSIILHEALPYWYLFVIFGALVYFLWKFYRTPLFPVIYSKKEKRIYYVVQSSVLILCSYLTVAGMRGGFTTAIRPITISNANQYVNRSADVGIVLNTPFSIFRTIGKKPFKERNYMSEEEAVALYSPLHTPNDTIPFQSKNVVVLILESFGEQAQSRGYMPFVDSLAHVGRSFKESFASGRKSIDGMPSVLSSIPSFVEPFILTPASFNELSGIAGELTRHKGYYSAFFHGAENGSMGFQAFARASGFKDYFGRTEYNQDSRYHGDDDFDGTWAIWDEEFLQFYCDKINEMPQPFVTAVFTATSHPPFAMPERYKAKYPATDPPIFAVISYSDNAVRRFFEKASAQPWFQNTIFVLTADHTSSSVDPMYQSDLGRYRVPIVFYEPSNSELSGEDSTMIASQTDIMPTILGMMHYDRPYIAFGQDLTKTSVPESFAVNYMSGNDYYQIIQGDWFLQFNGEKVVHAYRYKEDPTMSCDMVYRYPKEIEDQLKSFIQQYMYRMNHNQLIAEPNNISQ